MLKVKKFKINWFWKKLLFFTVFLIIFIPLLINLVPKENRTNKENSYSISNNKNNSQTKKQIAPEPLLNLQPKNQKKIDKKTNNSQQIQEEWKNMFFKKYFSLNKSKKGLNFNINDLKKRLKAMFFLKQISEKATYRRLLAFRKKTPQRNIKNNIEAINSLFSKIKFNFKTDYFNVIEGLKGFAAFIDGLIDSLFDSEFSQKVSSWSDLTKKLKEEGAENNGLKEIFALIFGEPKNPNFFLKIKKTNPNCFIVLDSEKTKILKETLEELSFLLKGYRFRLLLDCLNIEISPKENVELNYKIWTEFSYRLMRFFYFQNKKSFNKQKITSKNFAEIIAFYKDPKNKKRKQEIVEIITNYFFNEIKFKLIHQTKKQGNKTFVETINVLLKEENNSFRIQYSNNGEKSNDKWENYKELKVTEGNPIDFLKNKIVKNKIKQMINLVFKKHINESLSKSLEANLIKFSELFEITSDTATVSYNLAKNIQKKDMSLKKSELFWFNLKNIFQKSANFLNLKSLFDLKTINSLKQKKELSTFIFNFFHFLQKAEFIKASVVNSFIKFAKLNKEKINSFFIDQNNENKINWIWGDFLKKSFHSSSYALSFLSKKNQKFLIFKFLDDKFSKHTFILENKNQKQKVIFYQNSWSENNLIFFLKNYDELNSNIIDNKSDKNKKKKTKTNIPQKINPEWKSIFSQNFFLLGKNNQNEQIHFQKKSFAKLFKDTFSFAQDKSKLTWRRAFGFLKQNKVKLNHKIIDSKPLKITSKIKANYFKNISNFKYIWKFFQGFVHNLFDNEFLQKINSWSDISKKPIQEESLESIFELLLGKKRNNNFFIAIKTHEKCNDVISHEINFLKFIENFLGFKLKIKVKCFDINIEAKKNKEINHTILTEFSYRLMRFFYFQMNKKFSNEQKITSEIIDEIINFYQNKESIKIKKQINQKFLDYFFNQKTFEVKYMNKFQGRKNLSSIISFLEKEKIIEFVCVFKKNKSKTLSKCEKLKPKSPINFINHLKLKLVDKFLKSHLKQQFTKKFLFFGELLKTELQLRKTFLSLIKDLNNSELSNDKKKLYLKKLEKNFIFIKKTLNVSFDKFEKIKTKIFSYIIDYLHFLKRKTWLNNNVVNNLMIFLKSNKKQLEDSFENKTKINWKWNNFRKKSLHKFVLSKTNRNIKFLVLKIIDNDFQRHTFILEKIKNINKIKVIFYQSSWENKNIIIFLTNLLKVRKLSQKLKMKIITDNVEKTEVVQKPNLSKLNHEWQHYFKNNFFYLEENKKQISFYKSWDPHKAFKQKIMSIFSNKDQKVTVPDFLSFFFKKTLEEETTLKKNIKLKNRLTIIKNDPKTKQEKFLSFIKSFLSNLLDIQFTFKTDIVKKEKTSWKDNNFNKIFGKNTERTLESILSPIFGGEKKSQFIINVNLLRDECEGVLLEKSDLPGYVKFAAKKIRIKLKCLDVQITPKNNLKINYKKFIVFIYRIWRWKNNIFQKMSARKYKKEDINQLIAKRIIEHLLKIKFNFQYQNKTEGIKNFNQILLFLKDKSVIKVEYLEDILACSKWLSWTSLCKSKWKDIGDGFVGFLSDLIPAINQEIKEKIKEKIKEFPNVKSVSEKTSWFWWNNFFNIVDKIIKVDSEGRIFFKNLKKLKYVNITLSKFLEILKPFYDSFLDLSKFLNLEAKIPSWQKIKELSNDSKFAFIFLNFLTFLQDKTTIKQNIINDLIVFFKNKKNDSIIKDYFAKDKKIRNLQWNNFGKKSFYKTVRSKKNQNVKFLVLKIIDNDFQRHTFVLKRKTFWWKSNFYEVVFYENSWEEKRMLKFVNKFI